MKYWLAGLLVCAESAIAAGIGNTEGQGDGTRTANQQLAKQANNPLGLLTQLQFRTVSGWDIPDTDERGTQTQLQATLPFKPFGWLRTPTILRITLPHGNLSGDDSISAFGGVQLYGQAAFSRPWGSWVAGLSVSVPSADERRAGESWQAGPAAGFMITRFENLVVGALVQNPIAVSPSGEKKASSNLEISPTLTYNLPDGWFVGLSDFDWNIDWSAGEAVLPIGLQAGRVFRIGGHAYSLSIQAGRVLSAPDGDPFPVMLAGIEFTSLHPEIP